MPGATEICRRSLVLATPGASSAHPSMAVILRRDFGGGRKLGRPKQEALLQEAVAQLGSELLPRWGADIPGYSLVIAHELVVPYGRPDVVVASVDLRLWHSRRRRGIRACTALAPLQVAVRLRELGGRAGVARLAQRQTVSRVRSAVRALDQLGWVTVRGDEVILSRSARDAVGAMAGVEVKINDWRRAVGQVQSWEGLLDASWLAFPQRYVSRVPAGGGLRRLGVVAVIDGEAAVVRRPQCRHARGVRVALADEFLFARWMAELDARRAI
jgi:hypothetical protein